MIKVILDAGHGFNTAGKRTPDGGREWTFNNTVLLSTVAELNKFKDVQILRLDDPRGIRDIPLQDRTRQANQWGGDVLVSIHHNAFRSRWGTHGGVETYVAPNASKASVDIANLVQPKIVKAMGLRDRGVKRGNLHMVRESRMPAILTEGGFMDSETDIEALRSNDKLKAQGIAIAEGLAVYFKLKVKDKVVKQVSISAAKKIIKPKSVVKPKAVIKKPAENLAVDGHMGALTIRALQRYFKTPVDGVISRPSTVIRALQRLLGVTADGYFGPITVRALQRRFGTYQDGIISKPSVVIRELQRRLNNNKL